MGNNGSTRAPRKRSRTSSRKKPTSGVSRRALLIGGGAAAAAGTAAVLTRDRLKRLWWQVPGIEKPRKPGELDYAAATWVAASEGNWRRADRPDDFRIDRVIIHVTQGSFASAVKVFQDPAHRAATHYIVGQDGRVVQMIRELDVAYQAGDRAYNERSVGIEHEGFVDRPKDLTKAMYESSARLTASVCARYDIPIDREHIIGHVEVPGTDHTDPGPHWDWDRYLELVRRAAAAPPSPTPSAKAAG
ncbi:N-acetylmuramoyl-L-alanine amidase [Streptomyces sp. WZ.A104]|uniref:N-acetylmuramoyl-L-alanine amidase n=1 Tax=Streptomyces sp. WZ.A104 TaxID=2023771 RepID=UPI000BBC1C2C|nr:peptidoglycan recognition family protein [Streptomyces sp. WZ.A104]PCG85904.1 N-acetylmuramoyl-L-alanine amidase [Streptomyces sp. WZ.A104]